MNKNKLQRKLSLVLALSMLAPTVTTLPVFAEPPVNGVENNEEEGYSIEDKINKDLKDSIKWQIGIKPTDEITNKNILKLKELYLGNEDFDNLNGLEYAKNLRSLKSEHGKIKDLSALSNLPYFEELYVGGYGSGDGKPIITVEKEETLTQLTNLKKLYLGGEQIKSLEQLQTLTHLESLLISGAKLQNLQGIENFPKLKEFDFDGSDLKNLNELKEYPINETLETLQISGESDVNIEDWTGLKELKNLKNIYIGRLTPDILINLSGKETLERLDFGIYKLDELNKEKDLETFNRCFTTFTNLKTLNLSSLPIPDLNIVKNLSLIHI